MGALRDIQNAMMDAIEKGPEHVRFGDFKGHKNAILRGLSVHANTISHARLVALEETFELTRAWLGEGEFNALSREYLEHNESAGLRLADIGKGFAAFLRGRNQDHIAIDLARYEWAWLQTYGAPDATAFTVNELAHLEIGAIETLCLSRHPASTVLALCAGAREAIGSDFDAPYVLLTRPDAHISVLPIGEGGARLYEKFETPQLLCNLMLEDSAAEDEPVLIALISAGALCRNRKG